MNDQNIDKISVNEPYSMRWMRERYRMRNGNFYPKTIDLFILILIQVGIKIRRWTYKVTWKNTEICLWRSKWKVGINREWFFEICIEARETETFTKKT